MHQHLDAAIDHPELAGNGLLVGLILEDRLASIDAGMSRIPVGEFDDQHRAVQVQEEIVARVVGRIAGVHDRVSLRDARELVGRVELVLRPPVDG